MDSKGDSGSFYKHIKVLLKKLKFQIDPYLIVYMKKNQCVHINVCYFIY